MEFPLFQVDAFSERVFGGNPAAVVPVREWPQDALMQAIASENQLSETAFVRAVPEGWQIRWFTPGCEVALCGHATLAAAWVIREELGDRSEPLNFESASGTLRVMPLEDGRLELDFPARPPEPGSAELRAALSAALGAEPEAVMLAEDAMAVFRRPEFVADLKPNLAALAEIDVRGVIVTAPGDDCDFVSRFFAPRVGVNEDPVTGSAHCTLAPYWARRLEVTRMRGRQVSPRGGEVACHHRGDRVGLAGSVAPYLEGVIRIPRD